MPAIEASTRPVSNSSVSKAALASVGEGLRDMAATEGVDTHEGGPIVSE